MLRVAGLLVAICMIGCAPAEPTVACALVVDCFFGDDPKVDEDATGLSHPTTVANIRATYGVGGTCWDDAAYPDPSRVRDACNETCERAVKRWCNDPDLRSRINGDAANCARCSEFPD